MERKSMAAVSLKQVEAARTRFVGLYLPAELHGEFKAAAERDGTTITALLRKLIVWYLSTRLPGMEKK